MKKGLLWLLVLLLTLGILAGCASSPQDKSSETSETPNEDNEQVGEVEKEFMEISIALWDIQELSGDAIGQLIEDRLNIKVIPITLDWGNYNEQTKLFAASGDMPDAVATYTVRDMIRFYEWIDQEIIRPIPAEMLNDFPMVKQLADDSIVLQSVNEVTGDYYFIPRPESIQDTLQANQTVMYYRGDWLGNLGIGEPQTMDELYDMLKAFTEEDPDNNGKDDTVGMIVNGLRPEIFTMYGVDPNYWLEEDGKFIPGYMSKKNIDALNFYQRLYKEGYMDPEWTVTGSSDSLVKFAQNLGGFTIYNGDVNWLYRVMEGYGEANEGDPMETIKIMPPLKKDADSDPEYMRFVAASGTEIGAHVEDAKLHRILELAEFLLSSEGKDLMNWGIEDVDYIVQEDGSYKSLLDGQAVYGKYPSASIIEFTDWNFDFNATLLAEGGNPNIPDEYKILRQEVRDKYNPWARDERLDISFLPTPAKNDLTILWNDAFIQMIIGSEDIEIAFEAFIQDCYNQGVQTAIDEVNAIAEN